MTGFCAFLQHLKKLNIDLIGLYRLLDGVTNLKYKLLCFCTRNKRKFKEKRHELLTWIDAAI